MNLFTGGILLTILGIARGDYKCVCNYNVEKTVLATPSAQSNVLGYMYEFDCKPEAGDSTDENWIKVAYEHKVGYVEKDSQLQIQTCPGSVPDEDKLPPATTSMPTVEQTTLVVSTKPVQTTTTAASTTPSPPTTTQTTTIPSTTEATTVETTTARPTTTFTTTMAPTTTSTSTQAPTASITSTIKATTSTATTTEATTKVASTTTSVTTTVQTSTVPKTTTRPTKSITTNTPSTTRTTSTLPTTTTGRTTTAIKPTTTPKPSVLQGHIEMCSNRLQGLAEHSRELIAQFGQSCYEIVQTGVSWSHADSNCKHNGGHLIHIANQQEQDFIYHVLVKYHSHTVWLGLHDRNQEENFEWTSGNPVTYTNWKPDRKDYRYHNSEDCVFMTTDKGQWDDIQCGGENALSELFQGIRHSYICQYATQFPPATVNSLDGNTHMCPYSLRQQAVRDKGVVGQYDHSCYELVPDKSVAWQHAEEMCTSRGGHLAYINSIQEQTFVQGFLNRYSPNHAVWIGLTDRRSEGQFHWASGASVQFTNWVPGHLSNYVSSSQEDCVVLIPYKNGQWDDIPCGSTYHSFFGGGVSSSGETHPLLCQYRISAGPSLIG